ncbi:hypothetical protein LFYK43_23060 [Ligilactobacillus salitolerans]|uniref:Holin n=1 Tax=Ligilactobacillus salitolerans TaxID=1808352 RepID=A0A401IWH0_9LACO|nr:phage holin [Ligilactobacillus salitolerans]GBG95847.1 hypothetical protein LFYK43_23060 [Ligilactobacillus salitolerans]
MNKLKLNFNVHSAGAWTTLVGAILAAVTGVLGALGVNINSDILTTVSGAVTAVISLLVALGILVVPTDKKEDDKK